MSWNVRFLDNLDNQVFRKTGLSWLTCAPAPADVVPHHLAARRHRQVVVGDHALVQQQQAGLDPPRGPRRNEFHRLERVAAERPDPVHRLEDRHPRGSERAVPA